MDSKQRQDIIIQLLESAPEVDALTVMNVIKTDTKTITGDFRELIAAGRIIQSSPGHYKKPFDILSYLAQPLHMREAKEYSAVLLDEYTANVSSLVGDENLEKLSKYKGSVQYSFRENLELLEYIYIDMSYYSNTLAKGELTKLDTEILLKFGKSPKGQSFQHSQRILNYKIILDILFDEDSDFEYRVVDFQKIHEIVMNGRLADNLKGELREYSIVISHSTYEPLSNPRVLENQFHMFIDTLQKIQNPFEKSFFIFVFLPYILPFSEGNAELARIVMNIPLIENGCPVATFKNIEFEEYELAYRALYELQDIRLLQKIFLSFFHTSTKS
ncbi:Fic family protein [Candidatus Gracilibacteria bacterium]|nr:Fic family protein [Candidatus Gracilibacteria bacterium]